MPLPKNRLFPVANGETYPLRAALREKYGEEAPPLHAIRVRTTGEWRAPRKGEWFVSGAIVEGYRATNDYTTACDIAELVEVRVTTQYNVVGLVPIE